MLLYIIISLFIAVIFIFFIIGYFLSAPHYTGPVTDHFDGKRFFNTGGIQAKGLPEVLKWVTTRKPGKWEKINNIIEDKKLLDRVQGLTITYVNHSTFLIQLNGLNIITDPVWSYRVSPFSWLGPARMRPPGFGLENLPPIDIVLLSHNHYDHLDLPILKQIVQIHKPKIVTALGVKKFLDKKKMPNSSELDWWGTWTFNDQLHVQAVPAQHFSGRGMFDRDRTLWCGFVIKSPDHTIYFAGDTGYNEFMFKEIEAKTDTISVSLIPIGAYKPRWFMSPIHTSPEEAVKIHLDVKSRLSIATHFGTFPLADDGQYDPVEDLELAKEKFQVDPDSFIIINEGIPKVISRFA